MQIINIHEAKTQLSKLIEDAAHGKESIIAKAGKPVAKLIPITTKKSPRYFGLIKEKIKIAADFDEPLPTHILDDFES